MACAMSQGRVLIIAGSDPSGGAGIQADIKTVTALCGYAAAAITALTVQNSLGVTGVHPVEPGLIKAQAEAVLADIGADAIKTGMLGSAAATAAVVEALDLAREVPLVVDPVLWSTSGAVLTDAQALSALIPRAALVTPNAPEAEALTGIGVATLDDQRRAAERLLAMGAGAVLLKGGHIPVERVTDLLSTTDGETLFEAERLETRHTHGTGCTLASAIATGLAQGLSLTDAVARGWAYVQEAIRRAPGFGRGNGPLDHAWPVRR